MILLTNEPMQRVMDQLDVKYTPVRRHKIQNYIFVETEENTFYLSPQDGAETEITFAEIHGDEMWKVDKMQNGFRYRREECALTEEGSLLRKEDGLLQEGQERVMVYFKREKGFSSPQNEKLENMAQWQKCRRQLDTSDVYLLLPGKLERDKANKKDAWEQLIHQPQEVFDIFNENIEACIRSEYNYDFSKSLERKCLGEVILEISDDLIEHQTFRQSALVEIARHETGLCILEICVYNCSIGGNKLLNYYCGNQLLFEYEGIKYAQEELLKHFHIRPFGKKRSMVFAYGKVSDEAIINALANEEYPMGKIGGVFLETVKNDNVAQYDTAEVFVSSATMIERCKSLEEDHELILDYRIAYHTIEIFFVELLLFQDASIDKIYMDLKREQRLQETETDMEMALERAEQIGFDMGHAIQFSDYEQFVFPTTRASAKKVANRFGIDYMYEKYQTNKDLLDTMIRSNKRQMEFKQDQVKNGFLLLISGLALLGTIGESLYNIFESIENGILGYGLAVVLIAAGFGLYELALYLYRINLKRKRKRDE